MVAPLNHTLWRLVAMLRAHGDVPQKLCDRPVPSVINSVRKRKSEGLDFADFSMTGQRGFFSADQFHPDPYTQSRIAERTLNAAIAHADITRSYEEYLEIFDAFYADDIEGSSETTKEPIRGKAGVRSLVFGFLVPLHAMAEVGGVSISVRQTPIPGDVVDETHSAWTLELVGVTGKACTVSWRTFRKWKGSRVALEHHYHHRKSGEPLSDGDLSFDVLEPPTGFKRSS